MKIFGLSIFGFITLNVYIIAIATIVNVSFDLFIPNKSCEILIEQIEQAKKL